MESKQRKGPPVSENSRSRGLLSSLLDLHGRTWFWINGGFRLSELAIRTYYCLSLYTDTVGKAAHPLQAYVLGWLHVAPLRSSDALLMLLHLLATPTWSGRPLHFCCVLMLAVDFLLAHPNTNHYSSLPKYVNSNEATAFVGLFFFNLCRRIWNVGEVTNWHDKKRSGYWGFKDLGFKLLCRLFVYFV